MEYEIRTLLGERLLLESADAVLQYIESGSYDGRQLSIRRDGVVVAIEDLWLMPPRQAGEETSAHPGV